MKDTYYFSHDYNARNDIKIKKLLYKLGYEGYGIFWALVEDLYNNANALPTHYDILAFELRTQCDKVESVVNDFDLFEVRDGFFSSKSIECRLNDRKDKSIKASMSAKKRWQDANAMRTHSEGNAIKERKGKEIKESKEDNIFINNAGSFYKAEQVDPLPEFQIQSIKEQIYILRQQKLETEQILSLFHAFVNENIDGTKFYHSQRDIQKHFSNWIKKQKFNATTTQPTKTRQQTTNESLEYIREKGEELYRKLYDKKKI